jgi:hypothetical protein
VAKAGLKNTAAKFKVGDEVIRTNRPFELREIIKQLPVTDAGKCQYRIGPLPMHGRDGTIIKTSASGEQRDVRENELMRLDKVLDDLLKLAKAKRAGATRNALLAALWRARIDYDRPTKKLPPAKLVESLEESIETTGKLLAKLAAQYGILDNVLCKISAGIVDVSPLPVEIPELIPFGKQSLKMFHFEPEGTAIKQLKPPFEGTAIVRIQNLLRCLRGAIKEVPRKKRYGQRKEYKTAIVEHAVQFSCQHSDIKPSTDPNNHIHEFAERFYKRVVGTKPDRGLDYHVRGVLSGLRGLEIDRPKS